MRSLFLCGNEGSRCSVQVAWPWGSRGRLSGKTFCLFSFLLILVFICSDIIIIISLPVSLCLLFCLLHRFFQGERCSFSIQMWFYFLTGLRSDLWGAVGPVQARQTLAQVLCETLQVLVQRYSRARASYKRLPQIRYQIKGWFENLPRLILELLLLFKCLSS